MDIASIGCDYFGLRLKSVTFPDERFASCDEGCFIGVDGAALCVEFGTEPREFLALNLYRSVQGFLAGLSFGDECGTTQSRALAFDRNSSLVDFVLGLGKLGSVVVDLRTSVLYF